MNEEQIEDTQKRVGSLEGHSNASIQKAWNMLSMHNSELLLENYQLKEQIQKMYSMSVFRFAWIKLRAMCRGKYE